MKTLALMMLTVLACVMSGCGGMPEPKIEGTAPRPDSLNVRMVLTATNFSEDWVAEKVHLSVQQSWLNEDGVPKKMEKVLEKFFDGRQGDARAVVLMKDIDGQQTDEVRLQFYVNSGENPTQINTSVSPTIEWSIPSGLRNKDILMVAVLSRKNRNSYAIDVLYALEPATGEIVQILPSYDAK
jgi:hypothetical protein